LEIQGGSVAADGAGELFSALTNGVSPPSLSKQLGVAVALLKHYGRFAYSWEAGGFEFSKIGGTSVNTKTRTNFRRGGNLSPALTRPEP
jgi:hypothetical protein